MPVEVLALAAAVFFGLTHFISGLLSRRASSAAVAGLRVPWHLGVSMVAVLEGVEAWRGEGCAGGCRADGKDR